MNSRLSLINKGDAREKVERGVLREKCVLHFAFDQLFDGDGLRFFAKVSQGEMKNEEGHKRAFSIRFALKTFCITLKFAIYSYSCFAFILTRVIGTSTVFFKNMSAADTGFKEHTRRTHYR